MWVDFDVDEVALADCREVAAELVRGVGGLGRIPTDLDRLSRYLGLKITKDFLTPNHVKHIASRRDGYLGVHEFVDAVFLRDEGTAGTVALRPNLPLERTRWARGHEIGHATRRGIDPCASAGAESSATGPLRPRPK